MGTLDVAARNLLEVYRQRVASVLEEHKVPTRLAVSNAAEVLERVLSLPDHVRVAFLGDAQVGKSSLINALLGDRLLPTGGIGPLTAKETCVEWTTECAAEIHYHDAEAIEQLAKKVFSYLLRRGELRTDARTAMEAADDPQLDFDLVSEREAEAESAPEETKKTSELYEYLVDQARTLLTKDNPDVKESPSRALLLDGMWAILGREPTKGTDAAGLRQLQRRISEIQTILQRRRDHFVQSGPADKEFRVALRQRAAGWMSPLVQSLRLMLDHNLLQGLSLWDLPGVGVVGDPAAHKAKDFVEKQADVVVIVTRNTALTHTLDRVLEDAGVITKLLFGGRDGVPPIRVVVAVTHLDNVTRENYSRQVQDSVSTGDLPPEPDALFREDAEKMIEYTRRQVRDRLLASDAFAAVPIDKRQRREQIVRDLCQSMKIVPVVAPDFLNLQHPSTQRLAFLTRQANTGVPEIESGLKEVVGEERDAREKAVREAAEALKALIEEHMELLARAYEEGGGRASSESEQFREALQQRAASLTSRMRLNREPAMVRLGESIPKDIDLLCREAERRAEVRLRGLTKHARTLHWASLNAALARDGVWQRRDLSYPETLAQIMVDGIAEDWEPKVIDGVRRLMKGLTDQDLELTEELCQHAIELDPKLAKAAEPEVDAQKRILRQDARTCVSWTKERLEELRALVRGTLDGVILPPIKDACETARREGRNRGRGSKENIIETFEGGSRIAIERAREASFDLLGKIYGKLRAELEETYLAPKHDPIQGVFDALTQRKLDSAKKSDAASKRHVMRKIDEVRAALEQIKGVGGAA